MKVLLLFAAINTFMPSTSWAETGLVADYPELPADARKVVERSAACRHFADEIAGNGSERDRQVNRQIKKLRCNSLENDANRIRQKIQVQAGSAQAHGRIDGVTGHLTVRPAYSGVLSNGIRELTF
ncbi:MAG: hypothetical protein LCH89_16870 [Proteobacteria bacterium]|jgi:hypothetical protein|nr:hypothetical protein [Pseudomonadota bacterium]